VNKLKNERGQSMVEFAVMLPLLILIVMAILEFGMIMNSYLAINNAAREGARLGIVGGTDDQIRSIILSTSPSLTSQDLTIVITPDSLSRKSGDTLKITLHYNFHLTIPIISSLLNNLVVLNAVTSMRVE
jgi:Flp pilus assembly protein TadG